MEYNTDRVKMKIPEYGRHIHKVIQNLTQIKDKEKRNQGALGVIKIMGYLNPHLRDVPDFQHKLWDQLFIMSDFMDIDSPFPKPDPKQFGYPPNKINYCDPLNEFRHYGKIIQKLIKIAIDCQDDEKKEGLFHVIANTMKKNYMKWNRETVEDEVIFKDLKKLSDGQIDLEKNKDPLVLLSTNSKRKKKYIPYHNKNFKNNNK